MLLSTPWRLHSDLVLSLPVQSLTSRQHFCQQYCRARTLLALWTILPLCSMATIGNALPGKLGTVLKQSQSSSVPYLLLLAGVRHLWTLLHRQSHQAGKPFKERSEDNTSKLNRNLTYRQWTQHCCGSRLTFRAYNGPHACLRRD